MSIPHNKSHGMADTPPYQRWRGMRDRCNNPNNPGYKNYGGRGIKVCKEWQESFEAYYEYVGECPAGMSLDRIDVNGDYEPGNVRWASHAVQARNRRIFPKSEFRGVTIRKSGSYRARIAFDDNNINIGHFKTKEEAAYMYDCFALALYGNEATTNFAYS